MDIDVEKYLLIEELMKVQDIEVIKKLKTILLSIKSEQENDSYKENPSSETHS